MGGQVDIKDQSGSTVHWSGTATSTPSVYTHASSFLITDFIITAAEPDKLQISLDGSNWFPVESFFAWSPKQVSSLRVKSSGPSTAFYAIINHEDYAP